MKSATRRQCLLVHLCILALLGTSTGPSFAQQLPLGDAMSVLQGLIGGQLPPRMRQPAPRSQQPAAGAGPSFDCNRAKAAAEITICTHSDLAALDRTMAESYAEASAANPGQAGMLAAQQRRFRSRRDACGNSPPCLRHAILSQIAVLNQGTPQPMLEGTNDGPAALPVPAAPMTAAPVSSAAPALARPVQCDPPVGNGSRFVCYHQGLRDLDSRMVSAVGAILRSPTAPRDFEASQRAWMAQRDDCSNETCVSSRYEERLSQIAAFVPAAGTPDLADAGTVAETRRIAAEWGIPMLRGRLYLPQQIKRLQISIDETPVMRAWKKLMLATGLSAERDLIKQYNDDSLNLVACVLLDKAAQEQLGGEKICRQIYQVNSEGPNQYVADGEILRFFAGAEFASHDFAQRFAAERLPGIVAAAPKLPFQIITVLEARVSSYDRATGRFKVTSDYGPDGSFYGPGASFNVLGSPTDLVLKNLTWPASEQEARAFAASQAGSSSYHAFVAIPLTITGEVPGGALHANGLPNGHRWQVEAGDASLYNDARLTTRLYTFPAQDRLPRVIADTGAAAVPRYGDVPLNEETMVLALLKSGTVSPDSINWVNAAQDRYNDEQSLRDRTDWKHVDPWGLWFTANPSGKPDLVARFKDWTLRRAASLPDQVVLRQDNYFASAPNGLRALGQERTYSTSDNKAAVDSLREKGGGFANLLSYDYRIHASTGPIMAVSPLANSAYIVPPSKQNNGGKPILETVLLLGAVETIGRITLLHVVPLSASLRLGDQVLSQVNFPSPAEQEKAAGTMAQDEAKAKASRLASAAAEKEALAAKVEAEKTNAERQQRLARAEAESKTAQKQSRPPGAFGRDIAKVQLGMTIEQADATIRQQMKVAAVVELKPGSWGYTPTLLWRRIYASSNGTDMLTVYMLPQAGNRVVGIARRLALPLPGLTKEEASKLLTDKYGASSAVGNGGLYWTDDLEALGPLSSPCRNIDDDNQTHGYVYTEGKLDAMRSYWGNSRDADNSVQPDGIGMTGASTLRALLGNGARDIEKVRSCPPTLFASLGLDIEHDPTLRLTLVDGGWVAGLIEAERLTKSGGNVEAVKSLLDGAH